ncbi:MAG: MBL fold metallo-hydrolase [Bacteroidetes bacterium HGW-Bacteroidetes-1]|jgi:phosphoribosyl 1,2-cyclic phosphodiesterase|nr:MAG: MBL fold metallo-hydrolase [Bacteroidetes bacterium HGW-Bacteroidetes-1]
MDLFSSLYSFELCSMASGSSGNCYYVGNSEGALLIDAGISIRKISKILNEFGRHLHSIKGILISHDHIDHISSLETLTRKFKIPVYASSGTWAGVMRNRFTKFADSNKHIEVIPGKPFIAGGFRITAFPVSHDANEALGYYIENSHQSISFATDLGFIDETTAYYFKKSNVLILEANYDEEMLANGPYPERLRQRIRCNTGHLSNLQAADCIADVYHEKMSHIFLIHLSKENNNPQRVLETLQKTCNEKGITIGNDTIIMPFERQKRSPLYRIE